MKPHEEWFRLLEGLCNETITPKEHERLQEILKESAEARQFYREYLDVQAGLEQPMATDAGAMPEKVVPFPVNGLSGRLALLATAAAALITVGFFLSQSFTPVPTAPEFVMEPEPIPDFVLTRAIDVEWFRPKNKPAGVGQPINQKGLRLSSGILEVQFSSGATVTVEGPARLNLNDPMKCHLLYGKLAANCPPSAHGFVVKFPKGKVIDLGTEFALNATPKGKTDVHVLNGEVIVARTDEEERVLSEQNLLGHTAVTVGEEIEDIAFDEQPFSEMKRDRLIQSQPIKLQFDIGRRAGLYTGTYAPAHAAGDMFAHENAWTQIVGDQSGTFVMADGNFCPHPIQVDYGHGDGKIDWDAMPIDPWGRAQTKAKGAFNTALAQDHRPWDEDLALRVSGLPEGTYRVYALCRSTRCPGAHYDVSFGVNLDRQLPNPTEIPPMDPDLFPEWIEGV
ncbi:MAG: FecR domain-containing protein, partial [Verrucomicrobiota bacterium]